YAAGILAAVGMFSVTAYFFLIKPHGAPTPEASLDTLAFPQSLALAPDLAGALSGTSSPVSAPSTGTIRIRYVNTHYGFSLSYPKDLKVSEFDEGDDARTITFQNTAEVRGFQIFIVPYQGEQVSAARFRSDEPSGVMEQPANILVGGTKATMFFSTDATLGEIIEVWFIKNGYLFEITAPKPLGTWLARSIQTWEFL
ncbi:MAG: hypothetical protein KGI71_03535, partial [Patescibacteria group bacterium]|nr:hypothetical protein [Patescibacteria group bacterium]